MPGLVGIITRISKETAEQQLQTMSRTTLHETFYHHGLHSQSDLYTYVGWTCHRNSFADCMPVYNEDRNIILFFAGEVFPDPAQIADLRRKGHGFSEPGAGYLVHAYEEEGDRFFEGLNGTFSGLLMDLRSRRTFLFNDRFGMHRLFVHQAKDAYYFSSEAKALLAVLPETREFDPKGLVELMTCGCTLGDHSLFKGIEVLAGGTLAVFANGEQAGYSRYFDRSSWERQEVLPEAEFTSRFMDLLSKTAIKYASPGEAVGISLTGGFDSRMVMATLNPEPGTLPCYSFGSMYRDTFDVNVARQVAHACGQSHYVLTLGKDFLSRLPEYLEKAVYIADGYLGLSGAAELYVNSLAREIAPVRLTGNWGSELMRGVRAFKFTAPSEGILHPDLHPYVEKAKDTFERLSEMRRESFVVFQQAPRQSAGRIAIERSQVVPRTPFLDNDLVRSMFQASKTLDGFTLAGAIIGRSRPDLLRVPTDRGYLGVDNALSRACRRTYRKALFKAEYWIEVGAPDWLVKQRRFMHMLQKQILGRHKFYHFGPWTTESMARYVRDTLLGCRDPEWSAYFAYKKVEQIVDDHLNGRKNGLQELDMILRFSIAGKMLIRQMKDA